MAIGTLDFEHDICDQIHGLGYQFQLVLRDPANGGVTFYTNVRSPDLANTLMTKLKNGVADATSQDEDSEDEPGTDDCPAL